MDIRQWLSQQDERVVAAATGHSVHAVRKWRIGARIPRRDAAFKLITLSHGALSLETIYPAPPPNPKQEAA